MSLRADPQLGPSNVVATEATGLSSASSELTLLKVPGLANWNRGIPSLPNVRAAGAAAAPGTCTAVPASPSDLLPTTAALLREHHAGHALAARRGAHLLPLLGAGGDRHARHKLHPLQGHHPRHCVQGHPATNRPAGMAGPDNNVCQVCPRGTFPTRSYDPTLPANQEASGAQRGADMCTPCPTGYFRAANSTSPMCSACGSGSQTGVQFGATSCTPCPPGAISGPMAGWNASTRALPGSNQYGNYDGYSASPAAITNPLCTPCPVSACAGAPARADAVCCKPVLPC